MGVWHGEYDLDNVTPVALRLHGNDSRRGSVVVIQHSGHTGAFDVLLGGPTMTTAADDYGHRLTSGQSLTLPGWFTTDDVMYALSSAATGDVHVLIIGA